MRLDALLIQDAREVSYRLFVDNRRLGLSRLPDFRQVATGQEAACHDPSKRKPRRQANRCVYRKPYPS
jgi:hypothetical protein